MLINERNLVIIVVSVFLVCFFSPSVYADVHDVEVALDYRDAVNGIKIVDNDTGYVLNDSSNIANLIVDNIYKLSYKIKNIGDTNESVNISLLIVRNTSGDIVFNKSRKRTVNVNDSEIVYEYWNTSNLTEGLYNITINATIVNDSNLSNNFRSRLVRLIILKHDVEIALDYPESFNGIRIVDCETNTTILNNSGDLTVLSAGNIYNISCRVGNKGDFNELVIIEVNIFNSTNSINYNKTYTKSLNVGEYFNISFDEWNTSNLPLGNYTITVSAKINGADDSNLSDNSRSRIVYLSDMIPPIITVNEPDVNKIYNNIIPVNISVSDLMSNIGAVWYTLDDSDVKNVIWNKGNASALNYNGNINLSRYGGTHIIKIFANDTSGNIGNSSVIEFKVIGTVDVSEFINRLTDNEFILNASLKDSENNSIDYSNNKSIYVNKSFSLLMEINLSGINASVKIIGFNGIDVNWNRSFDLIINNNSEIANKTENTTGIDIRKLIFFDNINHLFVNDNYLNNAVIYIQDNILPRIQVFYIEDDEGQSVYLIDKCENENGTDMPVTISNMCYWNFTDNITIWVPHLSGIALGTDNKAPEINIIEPENNSIENDSFFRFKFNVDELNPRERDFCRCSILGKISTIFNLNWSDFLWNNTIGTYNTIISGMLNGEYNITINCRDMNGQNSSIYGTFSINDTKPPEIVDINREYSEDRWSVTVGIEIKTNEPATCRYDTRDGNYSDLLHNLFADANSSGTKHTGKERYYEDISGKYYIRCKDMNGNVMGTSKIIKFSVDIQEETSNRGGNSNYGMGNVGIGKMSCYDGIKNCHHGLCEEDVDCGGPCEPCPSCSDGIQNQGEEGIDCGGPCKPCTTTTTTTTSTTTTTTTVTTTTTSTSVPIETTTTLKRIIYHKSKEESYDLIGMITSVDIFGVIASFLILVLLILITAISVGTYEYRKKKKPRGGLGGEKRYALKTIRRGTRLGDI